MTKRTRSLGGRRLVALFAIVGALASSALTVGPAAAKGFPCLSPWCYVPSMEVSPSYYVSRLNATFSDGTTTASVSAFLHNKTGVVNAHVSISGPSGRAWGTGTLQEFFVDPALANGRAAGTFDYGGRTFVVDLTLEGAGDVQVTQPTLWPEGILYAYVYYHGGEISRSASGNGSVSISDMGSVTDATATSGSLAHGAA